ncbi:cytidine deaminase [candidate division KSB1 bacterium]|nr:cytidine deaminase [candidate division KSB1 bacterium]
MSTDELINSALEERNSAKAFFSNFKVGAILVSDKNEIYRGCNIEISSYGLTICAERVAVFKAVSEGVQKFKSIFIASDSEKITPPCGACRQVLWELCGDIDVYMINRFGEYKKEKMSRLLPLGFDKTYLGGGIK